MQVHWLSKLKYRASKIWSSKTKKTQQLKRDKVNNTWVEKKEKNKKNKNPAVIFKQKYSFCPTAILQYIELNKIKSVLFKSNLSNK